MQKHGVSFDEAAAVFLDPLALDHARARHAAKREGKGNNLLGSPSMLILKRKKYLTHPINALSYTHENE